MRVFLAVLCICGVLSGALLVGGGAASAAPTNWSVTKSPQGNKENNVIGVSCPNPSQCVALGQTSRGRLVLESSHGSSWSAVPSPTPPSRTLYWGGVSCPSPSFCVAAGYYFNFSTNPATTQTLIYTWNGADWALTPSPNVNDGDYLSGVSCTSSTFCVAVGRSVVSAGNATLIESWNGTQWSVVPSPEGGTTGWLYGVSCTSPTFCIAAGWDSPAGTAVGVIESWDGTSWSTVPSPDVGSGTELYAVSCSSPRSCMAVGLSTGTSPSQATLAMSWNGSLWTVTPTPSPNQYNMFNGVSCVSRKDCVAVGNTQQNANTPQENLIESWAGGSWSVTPGPNPGKNSDGLNGVSCSGPSTCVAVGTLDGKTAHGLVETGT